MSPDTISEWEIERAHRVSFRAHARRQRACQNPYCEHKTAPWQAHHIIYEQHVKKEGWPKYDDRNALRLCNACHARHHDGTTFRIPLAVIPTCAIEYAREVLGDYANDYLMRHYG
jgi:hypothetical protein